MKILTIKIFNLYNCNLKPFFEKVLRVLNIPKVWKVLKECLFWRMLYIISHNLLYFIFTLFCFREITFKIF